jgi:hypothetical protein
MSNIKWRVELTQDISLITTEKPQDSFSHLSYNANVVFDMIL